MFLLSHLLLLNLKLEQEQAREAAREQAQKDFDKQSESRTQECNDLSDLVKEEARDGNFDEAMDALEDCCSVGNPNNPRRS